MMSQICSVEVQMTYQRFSYFAETENATPQKRPEQCRTELTQSFLKHSSIKNGLGDQELSHRLGMGH
jgi:hypothetical protein